MASGIYDSFKLGLMQGVHDLSADTVNVALMDGSHAFAAGDVNWAAVSANDMTGAGYTAAGATLASATLTTTANTAVWDANDVSWTGATFVASHAFLYNVTDSSSSIVSIDFGGAQTVSAGTFTIQWNAGGIVTLA